MLIRTIKKKAVNKSDEKTAENIKKLRKEHEKPVKGMFEFIDAQGGWLEFSYRFFPGEDVQIIKLTHGEVVELPLGLVKHLNNTKKKVRRLDNVELSKGNLKQYETVSRVRFTPVDVM